MIITQEWTLMKVDQPYCKHCQAPQNQHTAHWLWLYDEEDNVGRAGIVTNASTQCKLVHYVEFWDDMQKQQWAEERATKKPVPYENYYKITLHDFKQDKILLNKEQTTLLQQHSSRSPVTLSKEERKRTRALYNEIATRTFLLKLSKHRLSQLAKMANKERERRYVHSKTPKYGNLNKGFTQEELEKFFKHCTNEKTTMIFQLMAYLGLRIGEAVSLPIKNIDLENKQLYVQTQKADTADSLYLHEKIYRLLQEYINKHQHEINASGYLFPVVKSVSSHPYISPIWARRCFSQALKKAKLDAIYCLSKDSDFQTKRGLHRLTTHSLRHYFITTVYKNTKDPVIAQKLARHKKLQTTQIYINISNNDLEKAIRKTFQDA